MKIPEFPYDPQMNRRNSPPAAHASAQQPAEDFLPRPAAAAGRPKVERPAPFQASEKVAGNETGSIDSFLGQLQKFLEQVEPDSGALEVEPPAAASQNHAAPLAALPPLRGPVAPPADRARQPMREVNAQPAAMPKPAIAAKLPLAALRHSTGSLKAGEVPGPRRRVAARESGAEPAIQETTRVPRKTWPVRSPGWRYAVLATLAGCVLGLGIAWQEGKAGPLQSVAALGAQAKTAQVSNPPALLPASLPQAVTKPVLVSDITSVAADGAAQVSIDLQGPVQYRAYRLHHPERVYFDLQNAELAPQLLGRALALSGGLILKIRSAQRGPEISRVTVETNGLCEYQAGIVANPYRLVIKLRPRPSARK